MADAKISQLPVASTPLAGTELVPVVQGGATEQTTVEAILTGTVPSGTANGVLYLNGSKVVTSGSALTFDGSTFSNVQGSGTAALSFNQLSFSRNGANYLTATLSSLNYGASQHIFGNNDLSSEWMRLTSTGLGIGTDNPASKLHVSNAAAATRITITDDVANGRSGYIESNFSDALVIGTTSGVRGIRFSPDNTPRMFLDTSGNLGIGTSLPSQKLEVNGNCLFTGGQVILNANTANYLYFKNASKLVFSDTVGNERMTLDSSGNLGLGVTPSAWATYTALQTGWSALAGYAAADTALFSNAYFDGGYKYIGNGFASQYRQINSAHQWFTALAGDAGDPISFTQAMTLDASGKLGIGTTSPGSKLNVVGTTAGIGYLAGIVLSDNATTTVSLGLQTPSGSDLPFVYGNSGLGFGTNSAERARIDSSGNLGLGVTPTTGGYGKGFQFSGDPASDLGTLWIQPINTVDHRVSLTNNAKNSGVGSWAYFASSQSATMYEQVAGQHRWMTAGTGTAGDPISFTQAMTLDGSGNLLVGKTSSSGGTAGIELAPAGQVIATRSGGAAGYFNRLTSDGSLISINRSNTEVGSISVTTTATAYNTSSDYRLKNITGPITTSGAYIDSLNPVEGTWKADGSTFVGLIAHEVQEASRTTVATGVKDGEEMQGMDYSSAEIIANLIAEVKALRTRVAKLEAK
jgi:hypothetical protein